MELDKRGADLLFQVLTECEEKASGAIASNESFGGWTNTFTDPASAAPSSTASPSTPTIPTGWPRPEPAKPPNPPDRANQQLAPPLTARF
ncbi:ATP-binding protein [Actinomadura montaniterrae]|uniref:ATP-binding protein n=1 Tax=Actinomadura montaniterrae TaxID=1803903 RepID=UPI00384E87E0